MALTWTGVGGLFTRIGRILKIGYDLTQYQKTLPAQYDDINDQFLADLQFIGGGVTTQANGLVRASSGEMAFASNTASQVVIEMVQQDQGSQSISLQVAMQEVIRQMIVASQTVKAATVTTVASTLTGFVGNGVVVLSTKRGDGLIQENIIPETLRLACIADSYTGNTTRGQEQFNLGGEPITYNTVWDYDYPSGSAASTQVAAISSATDGNGQTNILTNGDFEVWTPTTPDAPTNTLDNWTLASPAAWGTDIEQNTTNPNQGTYCVQFLPGTGVNTTLYQVFNDPVTGTLTTPAGLTSYAVNLWLRKLSGTISAGVLQVALTDGSGTVLNDAQGVANSFTVTLSTLGTVYTAYNGVFRLNATPPSTIWLRLRLTTPLVGASFLADDICMAPLTAMYAGGPGFAVFSGATSFVQKDAWNIVDANDYGTATDLGSFQIGFERLFSLSSMGLLLPSSGSPTISDALITA